MPQTFLQKIFRRKPINNINKIYTKLQRILTLKDIIGFGCATTVGSGLFVVSGSAGKLTGPSLFISFIIGGIACLFSGLCYGEFSTRIPVSGSSYTFSYATLGEIIGFIIGWNLTLEYGISASAVAQGWSYYLESFIKSILGSKFNENAIVNRLLYGEILNSVFVINIGAGVLILLLTLLALKGIKQSVKFTNIMTLWNIILVFIFIIAGMFFISTENWIKPCDNNEYETYCNDNERNSFFPGGIVGILRASGLTFFSYIGFDAVTVLCEETENPKRDMVYGLFGTLSIITVLYVLVALVLTGMVPFHALDTHSPLSNAFLQHDQYFFAALVSFGAMTIKIATALTCIIGQPRIFYRMSLDGLLYKIFENIKISLVICGFFSGIIGIFINFTLLAEMISAGVLFAYILVCAGILILL